MISIRVPTGHRPALRDTLREIREGIDEIDGVDVQGVADLDAQLAHAQTVTASPLLLWRTLMRAVNIAGSDMHGLCEAAIPSREHIEAKMREIAFYLDALEVVGSLDFESVA